MKKNPALGRTVLLATTLIWGTSFVIMKNTLDSVSTLYILAIRFTIAAILMSAFALKFVGIEQLKKIDKGYLIGGGLMGITLFVSYIFQTYGLVYTTPGKNAFLTSSYCILTPFELWIINRRKPAVRNFIAAAVCLVGIGFISLDNDLSFNIGDLLTLISGVFFALQIIAIENYAGGKNAATITAIQFIVFAIAAWIAALIFEPFPKNVPTGALLSLLYLGVMCTAVCFFLQTFGQQHTPPAQAAILMTFESVFGTIFSVLFYHEKMTVKLILGFALMFAAVILSEVDFKELRRKK